MKTRTRQGNRIAVLTMMIAVAGLGASQSFAAGWLAGASVGQSKTYDYSVGGPIDNTDDTDTAWRIFGGYTFIKYLGVVVSYVDLGEMTAEGPAFGGFTDVLEAKGFDFSAIGMVPLHKRFGLFGTLGLFRWKQDVHYVDPSGVYNYNDRGTSPSFAVGGNVNLLPDSNLLGIHFEYQRFMNVGDDDNSGHEYDRSMISAGAVLRFP